MKNIKLTLEYDGTKFKGWQVQAKGERTVQGELIAALQKICGEKVSLIGSGRTDSGVHAAGQVANFKTKSDKSCAELHKALNANIGKDVTVLKVEEVKADFHAQYSAKQKTYRYTILNRPHRSSIDNRYTLHFSHKLNLSAMRAAVKYFVGKKDFKSFQGTDPSRKNQDTVRIVKSLNIRKKGDLIEIEITANGFLYKMVRNIVGTLLEVGTGRLDRDAIPGILKSKNRTQAPATAKAHGLMLVEVKY